MVAAIVHSVLLICLALSIGVVSTGFDSHSTLRVVPGVIYIIWCAQYLFFLHYLRVRKASSYLWLFITAAVVARLILAGAPVVLTGDLPRYLWEGNMVRHGVNPYLLAPASPELELLRTAYWSKIEYPELSAIYPPVAQYFLALFAYSEVIWKVFLVLIECCNLYLLTILLALYKLPRERVLWYAFLPLPMIEVALSGHLEGLLITATLCTLIICTRFLQHLESAQDTRLYYLLLGYLFAAGALIKYVFLIIPAVFVVSHWGRLGFWRSSALALLTISLALLLSVPFINKLDELLLIFASLETYLTHWRFNDSLFHLVGTLCGVDWKDIRTFAHIKWILVGVWAALTTALFYLRVSWIQIISYSLAIYLLASPVVHPWYGLWFVPFVVVMPSPALLCFLLLLPLSYVELFTGSAEHMWWVKLVEYLPVYLLLGFESLKGLRKTRVVAT